MKKATTIEQQIEILRSRGVVIADEVKAKEILLDIGYYRLGFYFFPFELAYPNLENRDHTVKANTKFASAVNLYYFDFDLRNLLLRYTARIEVAFRTFLTYYISNKYANSPTWFVDTRIVEPNYLLEFNSKVYTEEFKKTPVIKRHHDKYINDRYAPAWKTIEMMSFGAVFKLYKALKNRDDKLLIAQHFGIKSISVFENYMNTIVYVRNKCAHGNAIFDMSLYFGISSAAIGNIPMGQESSIVTAIRVISFILGSISMNRKQEMNENLQKIVHDAIEKDSDIAPFIQKFEKK